MSEVYIEPSYNNHHHHNTNYSMNMEAALNDERDKVLFYAIIIIFTVLFFLQTVFFSYYIFKNCCKDTPYKRMKRKNSGMQVVLGKLEHNLDSEEQETLNRIEES